MTLEQWEASLEIANIWAELGMEAFETSGGIYESSWGRLRARLGKGWNAGPDAAKSWLWREDECIIGPNPSLCYKFVTFA